MLCDNRLVKKTWLMTVKTKQHNRSGARSDMDLNSLSLEGRYWFLHYSVLINEVPRPVLVMIKEIKEVSWPFG